MMKLNEIILWELHVKNCHHPDRLKCRWGMWDERCKIIELLHKLGVDWGKVFLYGQ